MGNDADPRSILRIGPDNSATTWANRISLFMASLISIVSSLNRSFSTTGIQVHNLTDKLLCSNITFLGSRYMLQMGLAENCLKNTIADDIVKARLYFFGFFLPGYFHVN